ncbi:MAG: carboxypeptidase regulatory-like protein [Sediminibacterium sp.]|nr:carboxypeptidase regulatory-like protein [Sediminibacterium sp.]
MITQGITGTITEATGNQMPMKDGPPPFARGILTTVLVYEPTNISQVSRAGTSPLYTAISTKQVASVDTDSTGAFKIELPAGSYSLFIRQGKQFYANLYDAKNNIALFTVEEGKLTRADLKVSLKASY